MPAQHHPWLIALLLSFPTVGMARSQALPPDQDAVRRAVLEGTLQPLAQVMGEVSRAFPGRIVEMELEEEVGRMIYEFDIVTPDGRLIEVDADAVTGTIIGMEEDRTDDADDD